MTACLSSTSIALYHILAQACKEIKILRQDNKVTYVFVGWAFVFFDFLFALFFFPLFFSFCCSDWPSNGLACS